jgi:hypothetical protein
MLPQIYDIAKFICKKSEGYASTVEVLLPVVHNLLTDSSSDVSVIAAATLADITELLTDKDRGEHILTIALSMLNCNVKSWHMQVKTQFQE